MVLKWIQPAGNYIIYSTVIIVYEGPQLHIFSSEFKVRGGITTLSNKVIALQKKYPLHCHSNSLF